MENKKMPFDAAYFPCKTRDKIELRPQHVASARDRIIKKEATTGNIGRQKVYLVVLLSFTCLVAQVGAMTPMSIY
jgi:hypothetical protein